MYKSILRHGFLILVVTLASIGYIALKSNYERNISIYDQSVKQKIHDLHVKIVKRDKLIDNLKLKLKYYRSINEPKNHKTNSVGPRNQD